MTNQPREPLFQVGESVRYLKGSSFLAGGIPLLKPGMVGEVTEAYPAREAADGYNRIVFPNEYPKTILPNKHSARFERV